MLLRGHIRMLSEEVAAIENGLRSYLSDAHEYIAEYGADARLLDEDYTALERSTDKTLLLPTGYFSEFLSLRDSWRMVVIDVCKVRDSQGRCQNDRPALLPLGAWPQPEEQLLGDYARSLASFIDLGKPGTRRSYGGIVLALSTAGLYGLITRKG